MRGHVLWSQSSSSLHVLRVDEILFFGVHACAVLRGALGPPHCGHHSRCVCPCFQGPSRPTSRTSSLRSCTVALLCRQGPWLAQPIPSGVLRIARLRLCWLLLPSLRFLWLGASWSEGTPRSVPPLSDRPVKEIVEPFLPGPGTPSHHSRGHQTRNALVLPPAGTVVVRPSLEGLAVVLVGAQLSSSRPLYVPPTRPELVINLHVLLAMTAM